MFVAQAHSFRLQARLAISLSWIAGYTNILTILICGQVSSHVSGSVSQLGRDVAEGAWTAGGYLAALLVAFTGGAALSGFLTETGHQRKWASIYVLPMAVEALLLDVVDAANVCPDLELAAAHAMSLLERPATGP